MSKPQKATVEGICQKVGDLAALAWTNAIVTLKNLPKKPGSTPSAGGGPKAPGRPMKFPYTFSAKIAQFPYKFYMKHNPYFKYYPHALLISMPVFYYISGLSNSPGNKQIWKEIRRKEREAHHDH